MHTRAERVRASRRSATVSSTVYPKAEESLEPRIGTTPTTRKNNVLGKISQRGRVQMLAKRVDLAARAKTDTGVGLTIDWGEEEAYMRLLWEWEWPESEHQLVEKNLAVQLSAAMCLTIVTNLEINQKPAQRRRRSEDGGVVEMGTTKARRRRPGTSEDVLEKGNTPVPHVDSTSAHRARTQDERDLTHPGINWSKGMLRRSSAFVGGDEPKGVGISPGC
ncbi:hypothetical protein BDZ89DRAFT_1049059 [Hymenopellis radicata]|nr:hypothetical protein BDZ89DRAFT_1049059 [Hymenopellis radicata]